MSAGEFIEVFEAPTASDEIMLPVGIFVEEGKTYLAMPFATARKHRFGLYTPPTSQLMRDIEVNGKKKLYALVEWDEEFDEAVVSLIDRLVALRWSLPGMRQLTFVGAGDEVQE